MPAYSQRLSVQAERGVLVAPLVLDSVPGDPFGLRPPTTRAGYPLPVTRDVVGQCRALALKLVDPVLHDVADTDEPAQGAVRHDRQVPEPTLGHDPHDVLEL